MLITASKLKKFRPALIRILTLHILTLHILLFSLIMFKVKKLKIILSNQDVIVT